ncbi:MAG: marine proteobacterial sortase target protein [Pseudomonadota bacterium]|nr:marine proteobacterial sortase target protein [Pseudomonadota bacterium]
MMFATDQRFPRRPLCLLFAAAWLLLPAPVLAEVTTQTPAPAAMAAVMNLDDVGRGSLLFKGGEGAPLLDAPLVATQVDIAVSGLVARAHVVQTFINTGDDWVEGVYVFPLPETAAVDHLTVRIGGRVIEGHIKEREEARRIYETAKQAGKKAGLLESERPNIFTTSIANIGPGEEIAVEIEYQQVLTYDQGRFSLRFPMVVGPRYIPGPIQTVALGGDGWSLASVRVPDAGRITSPVIHPDLVDINPVRLSVTIDAGFPLAAIDSPFHTVTVGEREDGVATVSLTEGVVPANRDFELVWTPDVGAAPAAGLFSETIGDEQYLLVMVMPPDATADAEEAVITREVIFIIDTSGSMAGGSINQARAALGLAIDRLGDNDRFDVIQFNSYTDTLFGAPRQASPANRQRARRWVANLRADGGTEMAPALHRALAGAAPAGDLRQVVFLTDGAVGNEDELFRIIHRDLRKARLFTIGIGSAPNSHFMREAAETGHGTFTYIGDVSEVAEKMGALFTKLESPLLTDLVVTWPDDAEVDISTDILADLYAGEPVMFNARIVGSLATDSLDAAILSGRPANHLWRVELPLSNAAANPGIAKLWARDRIEALLGQANRDGGDVRTQVVSLGLAHHLVTKFTSLVAVDTTPTRPLGEPLNTRKLPHNWKFEQVFGDGAPAPLREEAALLPLLMLADASATVRVGNRALALPQTATPAPLNFAAGLVLALFALSLMVFRRRLA